MDQATEYKNLGNEAFKGQDFKKAVEYFTKAIELKPSDHILYSNRAGAYIGLEDYAQALEDSEACLKYNSTFVKGYARKAAALNGIGLYDEAMQTVEEGLKLDSTSEILFEKRQEILDAQNRNSGGMPGRGGMPSENMQQQLLMQLLSNPATAKLFEDPNFLTKFQDVQQNPANIMKYQNDPQFMQVLSVLSGSGIMGGAGRAGQAGRQGPAPTFTPPPQSSKMEEEQIPTWEEPRKPEPKKEEPKKQLSEAEKEKEAGNEAYKKKDFDSAITHFKRAIELEPINILFRSNLIAAYTEKRDYEQAVVECNEAVRVYNETDFKDRRIADLAKIYHRHARVLELQEKIDECIAMYNKSLLENKEYKCEQDLKRVKAMKKEHEDHAYLNPELGDQARDRGNKHFADGKFIRALEEYQEALKRNPKDYKSLNNRATCYVKLMEYQLALKEVEKALAIEPNFTKALVRKGSIHHVMKEYHKAIEVLEKAVALDPVDENAKEQLRKTKMAIAGDMHSTEGNDDERMRRAMADPEIQQIMMDPMLKIALNQMQANPKDAHTYFSDPNLGPKLQKLIQAGILKVG